MPATTYSTSDACVSDFAKLRCDAGTNRLHSKLMACQMSFPSRYAEMFAPFTLFGTQPERRGQRRSLTASNRRAEPPVPGAR